MPSAGGSRWLCEDFRKKRVLSLSEIEERLGKEGLKRACFNLKVALAMVGFSSTVQSFLGGLNQGRIVIRNEKIETIGNMLLQVVFSDDGWRVVSLSRKLRCPRSGPSQ